MQKKLLTGIIWKPLMLESGESSGLESGESSIAVKLDLNCNRYNNLSLLAF